MKNTVRIRIYSLLVPVCTDGMMGLVQTALPLLAISFGANAWFLGILGSAPQFVRLILCLSSGPISDRVGRMRIMLPAAGIAGLACIGFASAHNKLQLIIFYALLLGSIGAFYPSFEAFIGDHSPHGELRKNLAFFNMGWSIGGALFATMSGFLFAGRAAYPFLAAAVLAIMGIGLVIRWSRLPACCFGGEEATPQAQEGPGALLLISRVGHFLGFFGLSIMRNIFPRLAFDMGMTAGTIGLLTGMVLVGQGCGMLLSGIGPWWRGKLWVPILAQLTMAAVGLTVFMASSKPMLGTAMFVLGLASGVSCTGALYYGMQSRSRMGSSTGIYESLIAAAFIGGSFLGGLTAQLISMRSPYIMFASMALLAALSGTAYARWFNSRHGAEVTINSPRL
jgi:MFS family permease